MKQHQTDRILKAYVEKREEIRDTVNQVLNNERGAGAVEYGLVIGAVVILIIGAATAISPQIRAFFVTMITNVSAMLVTPGGGS